MSEPPPLFQPSPIEPLRVEALQYHSPATSAGRPGIIVAVGVMSIILGALSILFSCGGIYSGMMRTNTRVIMAPAPGSGSSIGNGNPVGDDGPPMMTAEHRQIAVRGIDRAGRLTPVRREMLDRLLAKTGDKVFPFAEELMTEDRAAASVTQSGQVAGAAGNGDDFFILGTGRIEVGDDHASFSSSTRGEQTVEVFHKDTPQTPPIVQQQPMMMPTFVTTPAARGTPYTVYSITSAYELLLAAFLLGIGIIMLNNSLKGRRLHLIYVAMKLPAIVVATICYYFISEDRVSGVLLGSTSSGAALAMTIGMCLLSLIYPSALLIVMNVKSVKDYYRIGK